MEILSLNFIKNLLGFHNSKYSSTMAMVETVKSGRCRQVSIYIWATYWRPLIVIDAW